MANDGSVIIDIDGDDSKFKNKLASLGKTALKVSKAAIAAGAAAVGAFAVSSVKAGMQFDSAMSQVAATMGTTVDQIQDIRQAAIDMGNNTAFSATEAAEGFNYLALAGYSAKDAIATLPGVLSLAAAGNIELAEASDMVTDAQSALGLTLGETTGSGGLIDQMAKTASKSNTSVSQLGEAILTVGGTAKNLKGGITELNTVLGLLADNGTKGAEGGTALRNIILSLTAPTQQAAAKLKQLGISVFDAEGKMRSLTDIFPELKSALGNLTEQEQIDAISTIFNKTDIADVNALLGTSVDRWKELGTAIDNSAGAAEDMASTQLDNLAGDITLFKSALDGIKIAISDALTPDLRDAVQGITALVSKLTDSINAGDIEGVGNIIGTALSKGIADTLTNLPEIASQAVQFALDFLTGFVKGFSSGLGMIQESGSELIAQLADGLQSGIPEFLSNALPMVVDFSGRLREGAGQLMDTGLMLLKSLAQGIADSLPTLIENIPQIITNIAGIINDNAPKLLATGIDIIVILGKGIIEAIPTLIANIPQILEAIVSVFSAFNWASLGTTIITALQSAATALPAIFSNIGNSAITAFKSVNWAGIGPAVCNLIHNAIAGAGSLIASALRAIATNGMSAFRSINWAGVGRAVVNLIGSAIRGAGGLVLNALRSVGTKAMSAFRSINWAGLGKNIISGIVKGVSGAASALYSSLRNLASNALNAAKQKLGIASPSKVFRDEVGKWIPRGIASGIDKEADSVRKSLDKAVSPRTLTVGVSTNINDLNSRIAEKVNAQSDTVSARLAGSVNGDDKQPVNNSQQGTKIVNYTSNFYSPKPLTRKEIHRQAKQDARRLKAYV